MTHSAACGSVMAASVVLRAQHNPGLATGAAPTATLLEREPSQSWLWQDRGANLIFLHGVSYRPCKLKPVAAGS